jgi:uncharacterized protein involved in outer membrane biogenesis
MPRPRIRKLLRNTAIVIGLLVAAGYLLQRWVNSAAMRGRLTRQLEQSFGRHVEVEGYTIQWFPFVGLEADRVTIAEDPRFGYDYLLRADSVVAGLHWTALLLGRLEFGTIRFNSPSLNAVRAVDGGWNLESWLPAPQEAAAARSRSGEPQSVRGAARLQRIEIEDGRVDFRRGFDVRPFALTQVSGSVEQSSSGRWQLDFTAAPHRATVKLQDSGTLRITGVIAGTSARLQPAELQLTWSDASVADALRLLLGYDSGIRGTMQLQISAATSLTAPPAPAPAQWNLTLAAQIANLHSWELPIRDDNPQISMRASGGWQAGTHRLEIAQMLLEGARSKVLASGNLDWSGEIAPHITVAPSQISWSDLLDAYRAFTPAVAEGITADGTLALHGEISGFSRHEISLGAATDRVVLRRNDAEFLEADSFALTSSPGTSTSSISFLLRAKPQTGSLASAVGQSAAKAVSTSPAELSVFASLAPQPPEQTVLRSSKIVKVAEIRIPPKYIIRVDGNLDRTEAWLDAARALGKPLNSGWDATGGLEAHLAWQWAAGQNFPRPSGTLIAHDLGVRFPLINQPIELADAKLDLSPNDRRVTVTRASALGARWQGEISWQQATAPLWQFDLTANQLDANELDRWLGPRARPNWLARLFSSAPTPRAIPPAPDEVHARGHLRVTSFSLAPLAAENVQADLRLDGRVLNAQHIQAQLYGGNVSGALEAKLTADPAYRFSGRADGLNLAAASAGSEALARRLAGSVSGEVQLSTHGVGRDALLDALEARGRFTISRAELAGFNFTIPSSASPASASFANPAHFAAVQSGFVVAHRSIDFDRLTFATASDTYQGSGQTDFTRRLDLSLSPLSSSLATSTPKSVSVKAPAPPAASTRQIRVTGTLEAPHVVITGPAPSAAPPKQLVAPASGVAERH